jgi:hypothetical protein
VTTSTDEKESHKSHAAAMRVQASVHRLYLCASRLFLSLIFSVCLNFPRYFQSSQILSLPVISWYLSAIFYLFTIFWHLNLVPIPAHIFCLKYVPMKISPAHTFVYTQSL